jgi:hypothetical protein
MADPAHALDGFLAAFGANSTHFALATPDGRIKTYDTGALTRGQLLLLSNRPHLQRRRQQQSANRVAALYW